MQQKLWPTDTFVDFEHSINTAVKKLREALGDDAENPRFIETLPRRGYRLIAPVEIVEKRFRARKGTPPVPPQQGDPQGPTLQRRWPAATIARARRAGRNCRCGTPFSNRLASHQRPVPQRVGADYQFR